MAASLFKGSQNKKEKVVEQEELEQKEEQEQEDEGKRNLRSRLSAEVQARKQMEDRAAQLEAQLAEREAKDREIRLTATLEEAGFDSRVARLIPQDVEISVDAVAQWAEDNGIAPAPKPFVDEESISQLDRLNRLTSISFDGVQPGSDREIEELYNETLRQVGWSLAEKGGLNPYLPTAKELEQRDKVTRRINQLNKEQERMVQTGRMQPYRAEFGGRVNPPAHAARYLQND